MDDRDSDAPVEGWYGPPNSRRWHYFTDVDGKSLCNKWLVLAPIAEVVGRAYGPADGDCAACKKALDKRTGN